MRPGRRFLLIGLAVAGVEVLLGLLMLGTELAAYFFGCAAASAGVAWGARRLLDPPSGGPPGGVDGDSPPQPPWWPDFESQFRRHVRERDRPTV